MSSPPAKASQKPAVEDATLGVTPICGHCDRVFCAPFSWRVGAHRGQYALLHCETALAKSQPSQLTAFRLSPTVCHPLVGGTSFPTYCLMIA